jgi:hypothetical protein
MMGDAVDGGSHDALMRGDQFSIEQRPPSRRFPSLSGAEFFNVIVFGHHCMIDC